MTRRKSSSSAPVRLDPSSSRYAVVLAQKAPDQSDEDVRVSLTELTQLLAGLDVAVCDTVVQRRSSRGGLGEGKREEVRALLEERARSLGEHPFVVFDGELGARDTRVLEEALAVEIVDRTGVILRVFERRARTDVARLEITLAALQHELPRVRDDASLVGRSGGGGGRGERGHTNVELRKLEIKERITQVRRELERALAAREVQRARRADVPLVALVGYTNAGKSSLLRALTGSDVLVEDKLFATLGTTVRALSPPTTPRVLCADTVGFLRRLPNELLASFRSTLEEARVADLLLLVVDASDAHWQEHLAVTRETLAAIGADEVPSRVVLNKIDRLSADERAALAAELPGVPQVSARDADDARRVRELILAFIDEQLVGERLVVPLTEAKLLADVLAHARVVHEDYRDDGARLFVRARPHDLERWRRALPEPPPIDTADELLAAAAAHGLSLTTDGAELDGTGLDFLVVHGVDDEGTPWIVRTPRRPSVWKASQTEARVLRLVAPHLPVAVPDWRVHARDVIAYPRLGGVPAVTVDGGAPTWNRVDPAAPSERFLESFARTLAALQSVSVEEARAAGVPVKDRDAVRAELASALERTRAVLQPSDAVWARWQRWLSDDDRWPRHLALVHGDLHPGHMLLDEDGALYGVLDWTEACVTDPAVDLAMFHGCFGEAALTELLARFERHGGRTWTGVIEHAAERWAAWPVLGAAWALEHDNAAVLEHVRGHLAAVTAETEGEGS